MANLLKEGEVWLAAQLRKHAANVVSYSRGDDSISLSAVVGRTRRDISDESGAVYRWESRDYLVSASDLRLGGRIVEPQEGDRITEQGPGRSVVVHEVRGAFRGSPAWEWSNPSRTTLRIHTVMLGAEGDE